MKAITVFLFCCPLFVLAQTSMSAAELHSKGIQEIRTYVHHPYSEHILSYNTDDKPFLSYIEKFDTLGRLVFSEERNLMYYSSLEPAINTQRSYLFYDANGKIKIQMDTVWNWSSDPDYYIQVAYARSTSYRYDTKGNQTEKTNTLSTGKVLSSEITKYNDAGRKEYFSRERNGEVEYREEYEYDKEWRLIRKIIITDIHKGEGRQEKQIDYRYDGNHLQVTEEKTLDYEGSVISSAICFYNIEGDIYKAQHSYNTYKDSIATYDSQDPHFDSSGYRFPTNKYRYPLNDTIEVEVNWEGKDSLDIQSVNYVLYDRRSKKKTEEAYLYFADKPVVQGSVKIFLKEKYTLARPMFRYGKNELIIWKAAGDEEGETEYAYDYYQTPEYPDEYSLQEADTSYWPDEKVLRISTLNKGTGKIYYYYDNGILGREETYRNDKLNGVVKRWYTNGKLVYQAEYTDDVYNGEVLMADTLGRLLVREQRYGWINFGWRYIYNVEGSIIEKTYYTKEFLLTSGYPFSDEPTKAVVYNNKGEVVKKYDNEFHEKNKRARKELKQDREKTIKEIQIIKEWMIENQAWLF